MGGGGNVLGEVPDLELTEVTGPTCEDAGCLWYKEENGNRFCTLLGRLLSHNNDANLNSQKGLAPNDLANVKEEFGKKSQSFGPRCFFSPYTQQFLRDNKIPGISTLITGDPDQHVLISKYVTEQLKTFSKLQQNCNNTQRTIQVF